MIEAIDVEQILAWKPCPPWTEERIRAVCRAHKVEVVTPLEFCDWTDVSVADRLWVLLHEDVFTEDCLRALARWFAMRVVHLWEASAVMVQYLQTGDESLREEARAAAEAASWASWAESAESAAESAESAARSAAAASAVWSAAAASAVWSASAAWSAVWSAAASAGAAERNAQLEHVRDVLRGTQ